MGFVKVRVSQGVYKCEIYEKDSVDKVRERLQVLFREFVTDIRSTKNMIVVKTLPGNANGVGSPNSVELIKKRGNPSGCEYTPWKSVPKR